ncbi:hypothetical protein [Bremerella alba]|uniref:Uncharacterized protein n=1 Tax=Bremerella alba TaxID=980252 RepID=A0A7V8V8B8_9BACT|nr:hypothetical protein [Bremerella alba]MBA2116809.1 hypothetical protein [Bremerella alba]
MSNRALPIYIDDHFAMISGEMDLAQRVASENTAHELGPFLVEYQRELQSQRDLLQALLAAQNQSPSVVKQTVTWLAEKLGRLKPNDAWSGYTDLARVLELEVLITAAQARLLLWETLLHALVNNGGIEDAQHATQQQLEALQTFHQQARQIAFPSVNN